MPISMCRKRPFTTHADRLRSRLKGGRLPVAGPVARRAAGRGRRRRPRLRRLFAASVRDGARQLPARAPDGRRDRRLGARPPRPQPHPPGQHRAGPVDPRRGPTGAHRTRCADRHHHRCRPRRWPSSSGADPRTHPGRTHGRADATAAGSSRWRKPRCGWSRSRWRTATLPCPRSAVNSGSIP